MIEAPATFLLAILGCGLAAKRDLAIHEERTHVARSERAHRRRPMCAGELEYETMRNIRTRAFFAALGEELDEEEATRRELHRQEVLASGWRLFPDVVPCLEWLRATGLPMAAVSNASAAGRQRAHDCRRRGRMGHKRVVGVGQRRQGKGHVDLLVWSWIDETKVWKY